MASIYKFFNLKIKFHVWMAILFLNLGYFFINFSLLESSARQAIAFSMFGIGISFSIFEILPDILKKGHLKGYFIGASILLYAFFFSKIMEPFGEYGMNKYPYFMFVVFMGFLAFPPLLKYKDSVEWFSKLLFYFSISFCFFSIFYADASVGRRSEFGLNPAILARISMIAGIYVTAVMYNKGVSIIRMAILLLSFAAVFFTATKTPLPVYLVSFYLILNRQFRLKNNIKYLTAGIFLIAVAYLILIYFVPENFSQRILNSESLSSEHQSIKGNRFDLYNVAINVILSHPLGTGFGGFAQYHSFIVAPHNIILEISVELGIIVTVFFLCWVIAILRIIKKVDIKDTNILFMSVLFIYLLISAMFGGELTIQSFLLYLIGSFFLLYGRQYKHSSG